MDRSETIGALAAALAKAQGSMVAARKGEPNPNFRNIRYADLAEVVATIKGPLSENGLAYTQGTILGDGILGVETMLMHASGEWISSAIWLGLANVTPQVVGSATSYGRRYGLQAIVGQASDVDDDGNAAQGAPNTMADSQEVGKGNVTTPSAAEPRYYPKQPPKAQPPDVRSTPSAAQTSPHEGFLADLVAALLWPLFVVGLEMLRLWRGGR